MSSIISQEDINNVPLDIREEIFRRGMIDGLKHSKPSPETVKRLEQIESNLVKITDTLEKILSLLKIHYD